MKPYPENPGATHYDGCWKDPGHHNCAVELYERALKDRHDNAEALAGFCRHIGLTPATALCIGEPDDSASVITTRGMQIAEYAMKWKEGFKAYQAALNDASYWDSEEAREKNKQQVGEAFDRLVQLTNTILGDV